MLTIDEIREALKDRVLTAVAKETEINRNTIWLIKEGRHTNPTLETVRKLSEYLAPSHGGKQ